MNEDFKNKILKRTDSRHHRIKHSNGIKGAYKYFRKLYPNEYKSINEAKLGKIVRTINLLFVDQLLKSGKITLPLQMGEIEIRKRPVTIDYNNGKLKTNLKIDWNRTLDLWAEDEEAFRNKTLLRMEARELFMIKYNKAKAKYNNKYFYRFSINRNIRTRLKQLINNNKIDAFMSWKII